MYLALADINCEIGVCVCVCVWLLFGQSLQTCESKGAPRRLQLTHICMDEMVLCAIAVFRSIESSTGTSSITASERQS